MEQHSLQTASVYVNNLLLARGLLRNGKHINFARPDKASGGTDATMAKVINLVHDLVLKRDQEAEQRELLASTIRTLRNSENQHNTEIERIQSKCDELRRNVATAEAQERALKASARKAETGAKELKDQMLRMKSTLDQVRSKCQSDVRKRDIEMERLKSHLVNLQRGKRDGTGMNLISMAPHVKDSKPPPDTDSPDYSLEQETNSFLASFVKSLNADLEALSGEHKWLLYLIKRTMQELEDMMGAGSDERSDLGLTTSKQKVLPPNQASTPAYEQLAGEMTKLLEHCGAILSNPSYVSIEEVEIRENEIIKLREGWEKMAARLKEALTMMDMWRRRMLDGGETVNLDELGMGMDLGKSIAVPQLGQSDSGIDTGSTSMLDEDGLDHTEELPETRFDEEDFDEEPEHSGLGHSVSRQNESASEDSSPEEEMDKARQTTNPRQPHRRLTGESFSGAHLASSPARRGIRLPPPKSALKEINDNATRPPAAKRQQLSPRKVSFDDDGLITRRRTTQEADSMDESDDANSDTLDFDQILAEEAAKASSVSSGPRLTISEKLAMAAAEAREAEVSKKRKRSKNGRRRSTLAPEELEDLIGIH